MYTDTLKLIVTGDRRHPSPRLPERLNGLFRALGEASGRRAERIEDEIWRLWMAYRDSAAASDLERATRALAALDFTAAERILARLVAAHPDFSEAWNKRATLYYMQSRDDESVANIHRTLEIEPRHYGAICGFAQICLSLGDADSALFAFDAALRVNPGLENVRETVDKLLRTRRAATSQ
ncbi:MAG TPA: tetratricopeptide repeat protein [Burkholderiales bacterium]